MTTDFRTNPRATTFEVEDLVKLVLAGKIRIPDFQRPFRWRSDDVLKLFDSIAKGYPIGSLLLWNHQADADSIKLGELDIDAPKTERAYWVVDGQQRLTSLASTLASQNGSTPHPPYDVWFNLIDGVFQSGNKDSKFCIPASILFDLKLLMAWFRERPQSIEFFDLATDIAKRIRQYSVPAYIVENDDENALRDIFDRLNNYGKRMSRAEVFSALHTARGGKSAKDRSPLSEIADSLEKDMHFGIVDEETILRSVLARRGPDIQREIRREFDKSRQRNSDFPDETAAVAYEKAGESMRRAVKFLQEDADIPHFALLPYRHLLVVLTRMFALYEDLNSRELILLRRWVWRSTSAGASFSSSTGTARFFANKIVANDRNQSISALLDAVDKNQITYPNVQEFRTNHAAGKVIACALWSISPRSLVNGQAIETQDLSEAIGAETTPRSALTNIVRKDRLGASQSLSAGNRIFLPGLEIPPSDVMDLIVENPFEFTNTVRDIILGSHCIDNNSIESLSRQDFKGFILNREESIKKLVEKFLSSRQEFEFEDTPPLDQFIFDDIEEGYLEDS